MKCEECRGACCEDFFIPLTDITPPQDDASRWLALHARQIDPGYLNFDCKCTMLTPEGRCGIYATRPQMCADYPPGGNECLRTVKRRRTPEEFQKIRDDWDPATLDNVPPAKAP